MGSINRRVSKRGIESWQVTIRKVGQPTVTATFEHRKDAEIFDREATARLQRDLELAAGPSLDLPPSGELGDERLADTIAMFARSDACKSRHRKLIPTVLRNIGNGAIRDLKPSWGVAYIGRMRQQITRRKTHYCYESIVAQLTLINVVLKWRGENLDIAPPKLSFDTKKLPKGWAVRRTRRLEPGEEQKLIKRLSQIAAPSSVQWVLLVQLAIETAARLQELILAEWPEISPAQEFWTIPAAHTKSKRERVMPLTSGAAAAIDALRRLRDPSDARIFHMLGNPTSVSAAFHRHSVDAGLVDFRFHDLRHEAISRFVLTQRNFNVNEIMQMVGHSTPAMLARYSNLRGDELAVKIIKASPQSDVASGGGAPAEKPVVVPGARPALRLVSTSRPPGAPDPASNRR